MHDIELQRKIDEIHAVVVKGAPADEALLRQARRVVEALFSDASWFILSDALNGLAEVLGYSGPPHRYHGKAL